MLIVIARSIIIYVFLVVGMRLMGKRTIGEFQPFEFVIVLAVADLASTPMQDIATPLLYGILPLLTIFVIHYFVNLIASKSIRFRKFMNGKPMIIIDDKGINNECLKKLNMTVNDLMEMIRQQGYFSIEEVSYGIIETTGKLSIMKNENAESPNSIPMTIILEGRFLGENLSSLKITKEEIEDILKRKNYRVKDILLLTTDTNKYLLQAKNKKYEIFGVQK